MFSFISCKKNKENKTFISPEPKTDNSPKNEMIDIDELIEKFNLKNHEVKEYFKPFYDALKKFDNEKSRKLYINFDAVLYPNFPEG